MYRLELPPRVAYELELAAERAGVPPEAFAILLLNVAAALEPRSESSPFGAAVREFLRERSVGAEEARAVLAELVERCFAQQPEGGLGAWREAYNPVPYGPSTGGTHMVREQPIHAYVPPVAAPVVRHSAFGRYAHLRSGSREFAAAKEAEIAREDRVRR
ncbi:MAG TPA: hypothetical protein VFJ82_06715 [Longimicrobium sp.]|nr:hypothetical protein [Longimicrobium sp.]